MVGTDGLTFGAGPIGWPSEKTMQWHGTEPATAPAAEMLIEYEL